MYTRYTGYKCADCDFVANTTEEMDAHIAKKHKNAKKIEDYIGKLFLEDSTDTTLVFNYVLEFSPIRKEFLVTTYRFEVSNGNINKYSNTSYSSPDMVLKFDKNVDRDFIDMRLRELSEKVYLEYKEAYVESMLRDCTKFLYFRKR